MSVRYNRGSAKTRSWRSIGQKFGRALSPHARRRLIREKLRNVSVVIGILAVIAFVSIVAYFFKWNRLPNYLAVLSPSVSHVSFETDGVLNEYHLSQFLEYIEGKPLMTLDLSRIRERLESVSQVKKALITRGFPSTISIQLEEYQPVLKLIAEDETGSRLGLLVTAEGHVFKGVGYTKEMLKPLLFAAGTYSYQSSKLPDSLPQLGPIMNLLSTAGEYTPQLYKTWRSVCLEHYSEDPNIFGTFIKITTNDGMNIVFSPKNLAKQLHHLNSIMAYANSSKLSTIEQIDLSLGSQAVVKIAQTR